MRIIPVSVYLRMCFRICVALRSRQAWSNTFTDMSKMLCSLVDSFTVFIIIIDSDNIEMSKFYIIQQLYI